LNIVCPPAKAIALAIAGREFGIWDLEFYDKYIIFRSAFVSNLYNCFVDIDYYS
jgi:hypothetical protein